MVDRIRLRARGAGCRFEAALMDAQALALDDGSFDAALSIFGIILCPDPVRALKETRQGGPARRVRRPRDLDGTAELRAHRPGCWPPSQRCADPSRPLRAPRPSFASAMGPPSAHCSRPRAWRWMASRGSRPRSKRLRPAGSSERLAFAPGIATLLAAQGEDRAAVLARFVTDLERDQGEGPVALRAVAFLGVARAPAVNSASRP